MRNKRERDEEIRKLKEAAEMRRLSATRALKTSMETYKESKEEKNKRQQEEREQEEERKRKEKERKEKR